MKRFALTALMTLGLASPALAQSPNVSTPNSIVTQGEAILKRAPDRAWVSVSTETRDPKAAEARRRNADAMTAVQSALKAAGVSSSAIRTTGFSVTPEFDWNDGRSILRGYVARNQVEVRVDDLDRLSAVLDAVNAPKNVAISVTGPRFDLKDERSVRNEALKAAVEDALSRAEAIASGAKRTVGPILRIEEQNALSMPPRPMPMMRMAAAEAQSSTPVNPGEIEVAAQVTLTVEIR
jgi:uncharacterized protein YggE